MNLFPSKNIKNLLKIKKFYPLKNLGQNFLIDKEATRKIIKAAKLTKKDIVLEIGPGVGNLTCELAKMANKIIAVEKDKRMVEILKNTLNAQNVQNVKIINADILKWFKPKGNQKSKPKIKNYKVVANLPYYITSRVIRLFLESSNQPKTMVLTIQKEVAERICAIPPKMNLLAVSVQFYGKPKIIGYIAKESFWPQPKVNSAIIKISNIKNQKLKINTDLFFKVVKAGFSQPRKQIANNLTIRLKLKKEEVKKWLAKNKINPEQRAETLKVKNWINLSKIFNHRSQ